MGLTSAWLLVGCYTLPFWPQPEEKVYPLVCGLAGTGVLGGQRGPATEWLQREEEFKARRQRAHDGDTGILPSVRRDLFSPNWETRLDALEAVEALGSKARSELDLLRRYYSLYPWDAAAVVVLARIGGPEAEQVVEDALHGPHRFATLATLTSWPSRADSIDWKPYVSVLLDIAERDPRFRARLGAQQLLARAGVEMLIAPHRCYPISAQEEKVRGGLLAPATTWTVPPYETTIDGQTYRLGQEFRSMVQPGGISASCQLAKKNVRRRLWYPVFHEALDGCIVGDSRGEWGGSLEYHSATGEACALNDYFLPRQLFEWRGELWALGTLALLEGSALQQVVRDASGHPRAGEVVSLGGYLTAWKQEDEGSLLFLLSVHHVPTQCDHAGEKDTNEYLLLRVHQDLTLEAVGGLEDATLPPPIPSAPSPGKSPPTAAK